MAPVNRLFVGQLTPGDFRARISKAGHNADDPTLSRDKLQMDSAWPFAGNIHKVMVITPGLSGQISSPRTAIFPELPYVPMVLVLKGHQNSNYSDRRLIAYGPVGPSHDQQISHRAYTDRVVVTFPDGPYGVIPQSPGLPRFNDGYLIVIVFKIPARLLSTPTEPKPLPRMVIGKRGVNFGLYVSRPGINVETCSPDWMTFNSDDAPVEVSTTQTGNRLGASSSIGDGVTTDINVSFVWKVYFPIVLMFVTKALNASNQWYYLPTYKRI